MFLPLGCRTKNRIQWCQFCGDNYRVNKFLEGKMLLILNKDTQVCVHTFEWAANSTERMHITHMRKGFRAIICQRNILGKESVTNEK